MSLNINRLHLWKYIAIFHLMLKLKTWKVLILKEDFLPAIHLKLKSRHLSIQAA